MQQKTGRAVPFEITEPTRDALAAWLRVRGGRPDDSLFPSRSAPGQHIGTRQYARLVDKWVVMIDLEPTAYGTHRLRRTKVSLIYNKPGNLRACQLLLGHGKLESTVRSLGIEVDDALALSEQLELRVPATGPTVRSSEGSSWSNFCFRFSTKRSFHLMSAATRAAADP